MTFFTITRNNDTYSDDVAVFNFLDTGDGVGRAEAETYFDVVVTWGCMDECTTTVDMWVFDVATKKTSHLKSVKINTTMFEEEDDLLDGDEN